jgi:hypothetical protein
MRLHGRITRSELFTLSLATASFLALAGCVGDADEGGDEYGQAVTSTTTLVRQGSNKCLDVNAASTANGAVVQQWSCNGTGAQSFGIDDRGGGIFRLKNTNSGKCVDVVNGGSANGTRIQQWSCSSGESQKWQIQGVAGGYSRLVNPATGKCLDVSASSDADGAIVQLWDCNGTGAQSWKLGGGSTPPPTDPPPTNPPPTGDNLVYKKANLTNFTSYPEPGSDECENYNGCMWAGYFAFVDGKQTENWVMNHNIIAVHSKDANAYKLKTLRLKKGGKQIDAIVYDMCSDSDCSGCCTQNSKSTGFLIDIEKYTMAKFGNQGDGTVDWACVNCGN